MTRDRRIAVRNFLVTVASGRASGSSRPAQIASHRRSLTSIRRMRCRAFRWARVPSITGSSSQLRRARSSTRPLRWPLSNEVPGVNATRFTVLLPSGIFRLRSRSWVASMVMRVDSGFAPSPRTSSLAMFWRAMSAFEQM